MHLAVVLHGWQIECCADPPGLGDRVEWPVTWVDDPSGPGNLHVDWRAEPLAPGAWNEPGDRLLRHGPVAAYWRGRDPVPAHGALVADLHAGVPEAVLPITGTVLSVDVVDQAYRFTDRGTYVPVPGDFRLRAVDRSPKWFASEPWAQDGRVEHVRSDSGVLVRLSIGPAILGP